MLSLLCCHILYTLIIIEGHQSNHLFTGLNPGVLSLDLIRACPKESHMIAPVFATFHANRSR